MWRNREQNCIMVYVAVFWHLCMCCCHWLFSQFPLCIPVHYYCFYLVCEGRRAVCYLSVTHLKPCSQKMTEKEKLVVSSKSCHEREETNQIKSL